MSEYHEPLATDPRSYESEDGDILPLEIMTDAVQPRPDWKEYPMVPVPDSELEGPTYRAIRKALAEQAIQDGPAEVTTHGDAEIPDAQDRFHGTLTPAEIDQLKDEHLDPATAMRLLHKETGFYARDAHEKNIMQAIVGRSGEAAYPTLKYLSDVQGHQTHVKAADPKAASHSIIRHLEEYATQADKEVRFTRLFERTIADRPINMHQKFSTNISSEDFMTDEPSRRSLISIVRLIEADRFAEEGEGKYPLAVRNGVDSLKGKAVDAHVFALLDTMQFKDIMKYAKRLIIEENNRFDYWRAQIEEATRFLFVRGQAHESLEKLDVLRPRW